jgi:hypothetical protein
MTTVNFSYSTKAPDPLTPAELAQRFEDARLADLVMNLALPLMAMPDVIEQAYRSTAPPTPHPYGIQINRLDGTWYERTSVEDIMAEAQSGFRFLLGGDLYRLSPMLLTIWLDNEVNRTKLWVARSDVPELELIRHLRNASAHGNRFHLVGKEPKRSASFKNFVVDASLHRTEAFYTFMGPGDFLELLDHVAAWLRKGPS